MTAISFDPDSGRVRLDQPAFDCLLAYYRGEECPGPQLAALREAGVVGSAGVDPRLEAAMGAVVDPVCRLWLELVDHQGDVKAADGWVRSDLATLLVDLREGSRDLVTLAPYLLPAAIARVVGLGPRPRSDNGAVPVPADALQDAFSAGPEDRQRAAALMGRSTATADGDWRLWRAEMTWTGAGGAPAGRSVEVLDAHAGLFLADPEDDQALLWPATPTDVWRLLIRLLPDTSELG